jgi:hypothetical protein
MDGPLLELNSFSRVCVRSEQKLSREPRDEQQYNKREAILKKEEDSLRTASNPATAFCA